MRLLHSTHDEQVALGRYVMTICDGIMDGMQKEQPIHRDMVVQGIAPLVLQNLLD